MKKYKILAIVLTLTMMAGAVSACGSSNETPSPAATASESPPEENSAGTAESETAATEEAVSGNFNEFGWEIPKETLKISTFDADGNYAPTDFGVEGYENTVAYYKEHFNIELSVGTTAGDGVEALNLMLASNDYPDIISSINNDMTKKFVQQNRVVELTPYMDTIGKDLKESMGDMYPLFLDEASKLWYVPRYMGALYELPDYSAHIRYDEYNAIGAPKIETPDDYYNAVNAILEKFPTTPNGETRYAISLYDDSSPEDFVGYWGLKKGYKIGDDNSFTYWAYTDEGKEMSKFFNRFYRDGTMDPDAFVNKFDEWKSKFSNERIVGAIGSWWISYNAGHEVWNEIDPNTPEDKRFIQVSFKAPEAEAAYITGKNEFGSSNSIITDKATDVEGIMKFFNFQATERGRALTNWGLPNGTPVADTGRTIKLWNIDEDGNWSFDADTKEAFINESFSYQDENVLKGIPIFFCNVSRWADGEHCIWGNQMWYSENKWKSIMMENMEGTIYNASTMILRDKGEDTVMMEQAIKDARKMAWPAVVQANSDEEFEAAWTTLQQQLDAAGIHTYEQEMSSNYLKNIEKLGE